MDLYNVQATTEFGEEVILQVYADNPQEAEMIAISMVELGQATAMSLPLFESTLVDLSVFFTRDSG